MSNYGDRAMRFVGEAWQQARDTRLQQEVADGFNAAANLTMETITAKTDALKSRMTSGKGLSSAEQAVYAELDSLRTELHEAYIKAWQPASE